jgi:hypothetical protein
MLVSQRGWELGKPRSEELGRLLGLPVLVKTSRKLLSSLDREGAGGLEALTAAVFFGTLAAGDGFVVVGAAGGLGAAGGSHQRLGVEEP